MRRALLISLALIGLLFGAVLTATGQTDEKSSLISFVENQISSPTFQISLNGIEGALSSDVQMSDITIADDDGIWLTIVRPKMVWTRSALLSGRLEINSLTADRIEWLRQPNEDESIPAPEAQPFSLPELPIAVMIEQLKVPEIELGRAVMNLPSRFDLEGKVQLESGKMDIALLAKRLDAGGTSLNAISRYEQESGVFDIDLNLAEPANGLIANLLEIENRPPVALSVKGSGPVDTLQVGLAFDVNSKRILDGQLGFERRSDILSANARLWGPLSRIMAEESRAFFGSQTEFSTAMAFPDTGGVKIERLDLRSGVVRLAANASTAPDGFLTELNADLVLENSVGSKISLPWVDGQTRLDSANLDINYDVAESRNWTTKGVVNGMETNGTGFEKVLLTGEGLVFDAADPKARKLDFDIKTVASGITSNDPAIVEALGEQVTFIANGGWQAGEGIRFFFVQLASHGFELFTKGHFFQGAYEGEFDLEAEELAVFSGVAGRQLGGKVSLDASGTLEFLSGGYNLLIDGNGENLLLGNERLDKLFDGRTRLSGAASRNTEGLQFEDFMLANRQLELSLDGGFSSSQSDLKLQADIVELGKLDDRSKGRAALAASLIGEALPFTLNADVSMPDGSLVGKPVEDLRLRFTGASDGKSYDGVVSSGGRLANAPFSVAAELDGGEESLEVRGLDANIGKTTVTGNLTSKSNGLIDANLSLESSDVSAVAALLLAEATGSMSGKISLAPSPDEKQSLNGNFQIADFSFDSVRISGAELLTKVDDLFGSQKLDASLSADQAVFGNVETRKLKANADTVGTETQFSLDAELVSSAQTLSVEGNMEAKSDEQVVRFSTLQLQGGPAPIKQAEPTVLKLSGGDISLENVSLLVGQGSLRATGAAGSVLDVALTANELPLAIANTVSPRAGIGGKLNGSARITGPSSDPEVDFDIEAGGLEAAQIKAAGLAPVNVKASGNYAASAVTLQNVAVTNTQQMKLNASGRIPLAGSGISLKANGTAPLSIVNTFLQNRGASAKGTAQLELTVDGSIEAPQFNGGVSVRNATFQDPTANLIMDAVNLDLALGNGRQVGIKGKASLRSGGNVRVNGTLGLAGNYPADLSISLDRVRYTDAQTFDTRGSGTLAFKGPLNGQPLLSGEVELERTEITVPDSFAAGADILEIEHIDPSSDTRQTLERIRRVQPSKSQGGGASSLNLDVLVKAPSRIFVRGRGLDAELGGQVRVTGPASAVSPIGAFELRRGRLSIIGRRFNLDVGRITLEGSLDPLLEFVSSVDADDIKAYIQIEGRVSDPAVIFYSQPELPEDEVLARVVFGRSISELSTAQVVRLAAIANELTGGNAPSLIDGIRNSVGLDDVEVVTSDDGEAAVRAGKYIGDNVYVGVEAGQRDTEATINLDLTDTLKARGSVDSQGNSKLGVFFESDY